MLSLSDGNDLTTVLLASSDGDDLAIVLLALSDGDELYRITSLDLWIFNLFDATADVCNQWLLNKFQYQT